jgi:hypothetical protein
MNWLLIFFPVAIGLEIFAPDRHLLVFAASSLAIPKALALIELWDCEPSSGCVRYSGRL